MDEEDAKARLTLDPVVERILAERDKRLETLREGLEYKIAEGVANLEAHIVAQVAQVKAAVESVEKLDIERQSALWKRMDSQAQLSDSRLENIRRESELVANAAAAAIAKAEAATEKRFESVNEFRAQLALQAAEFIPREVAEAQINDLRRAIAELTEKVSRLV